MASEVEKRRSELIAKMDTAETDALIKKSTETHEVAQRKLEQMDKLRGALGMSSGMKEGDAFNRELQVGQGGFWHPMRFVLMCTIHGNGSR